MIDELKRKNGYNRVVIWLVVIRGGPVVFKLQIMKDRTRNTA
jgi:hypothetical protein